jgi:hypothetical protein
MKTYQVTLKYTAYAHIEVEAESPEQAELMAWATIDGAPDEYCGYGEWERESIEEQA